ncbi:MAG: hypothetical protein Q9184_000238 [Pyrenodesmia sp. 2 TL-2023]
MDPQFHLGSRSMEKKASLLLLDTQVRSEQVDASTPDELLSTKQAGNETPSEGSDTSESNNVPESSLAKKRKKTSSELPPTNKKNTGTKKKGGSDLKPSLPTMEEAAADAAAANKAINEQRRARIQAQQNHWNKVSKISEPTIKAPTGEAIPTKQQSSDELGD